MPEQVRICMRRIATNPAEFDQFNIYQGFCNLSARMFATDVRDMFDVVPVAVLEVDYSPTDTYWYIDVQLKDTPNNTLAHNTRTQLLNGERISYDLTSSETWEYTIQDRAKNLLLNSKRSTTTYFQPDDVQIIPFTGDDTTERMYKNMYVRDDDLQAKVPELEEKPIEPPVPNQPATLSLRTPQEDPEDV